MSGFIYIWFDKKHSKFYIGSHWGSEDDGYICSSRSMRKAYNRRKEDFKRRIISRISSNRLDLLKEEQRWLDMIDREDFGRKYYNISSSSKEATWWANEETRKLIGEKISKKHLEANRPAWNKGKPTRHRGSFKAGDEHHSKKPGFVHPLQGTKLSEERCRQIGDSKRGIPSPRKGKTGYKQKYTPKRPGWTNRSTFQKGHKMSPETIRKREETRKRNDALRKALKADQVAGSQHAHTTDKVDTPNQSQSASPDHRVRQHL